MEINLQAIFIANIMGLTILFAVAIGHSWRLSTPSRENRILIAMFFTCFLSCIVDPLCFYFDGKNRIAVMLMSMWIYAANIIITLCWHALISTHLGIRLKRIHKMLLTIPAGTLMLLLIVNIFVPIVFEVSEAGVYTRNFSVYMVYLAVELLIVLDALAMYVIARGRSGRLKLFPAFAFIIPAIIGIVIQTVSYGVSTMYPFYAVSVSCVAACLQNEYLFRDKLTGLYNRFYLGTLGRRLSKVTDKKYTAYMLDINGFKSINDQFGHKIGDQALVETAQILQDVIGESGSVIRYAGDEFIVVQHTTNKVTPEKTVESILDAFKEFNRISLNPYKLSIAVGYCEVNPNSLTVDELMDRIDKLMYENKKHYYDSNPQAERRK